jgi:AraC-like DNA-binding protein
LSGRRKLAGQEACLKDDAHGILNRVNAQLKENPRISLSQIARSLGLDRHVLENTIRHCELMSFHEYRNQKLVSLAFAHLNKDPTLTLKELAALLRYESPAAFARFLKARTGKRFTELRTSAKTA